MRGSHARFMLGCLWVLEQWKMIVMAALCIQVAFSAFPNDLPTEIQSSGRLIVLLRFDFRAPWIFLCPPIVLPKRSDSAPCFLYLSCFWVYTNDWGVCWHRIIITTGQVRVCVCLCLCVFVHLIENDEEKSQAMHEMYR